MQGERATRTRSCISLHHDHGSHINFYCLIAVSLTDSVCSVTLQVFKCATFAVFQKYFLPGKLNDLSCFRGCLFVDRIYCISPLHPGCHSRGAPCFEHGVSLYADFEPKTIRQTCTRAPRRHIALGQAKNCRWYSNVGCQKLQLFQHVLKLVFTH